MRARLVGCLRFGLGIDFAADESGSLGHSFGLSGDDVDIVLLDVERGDVEVVVVIEAMPSFEVR